MSDGQSAGYRAQHTAEERAQVTYGAITTERLKGEHLAISARIEAMQVQRDLLDIEIRAAEATLSDIETVLWARHL